MTTGPPFKKGDIVRLKSGNSPQRVLAIDLKTCRSRDRSTGQILTSRQVWFVRAVYLSSEHYRDYDGRLCSRRWRVASDYELHPDHSGAKQEEETTVSQCKKLYETVAEPKEYGTFLTTDSKGRMVLEMKPSGEVKAFKKKDINEVLPYTVELTQFMRQDTGQKGQSKHLLAVEGQVEKDDCLLELSTGLLWRVTKLDSRCRSASHNRSKWAKVPMEMVEFGETEPVDLVDEEET